MKNKVSRRVLSLVLALILVVSCVIPTSVKASSEVQKNSSLGALSLVEGSDSEGTGESADGNKITANVVDSNKTGPTGLDTDGNRASGKVEGEPDPEEEVTLIVTLEEKSLLEAGFKAADIVAGTSAVSRHEAKQTETLDQFVDTLEDELADETEFEVGYTYKVATTAVSVKTTYENKAKIQEMEGVKSVYVAPVYSLPTNEDRLTPLTSNATTMIGSNIVNQSGYTGKGMRIAILDTGIVVDHPNFGALSEDKLTEDSMDVEELEAVWSQLNASDSTIMPGSAYYSTKIPFTFNYELKNTDVSHELAGSDHGTHVAGIAAANKIDGVDVVGVAPDAQLFVMQVFSGNGADWATIMAALEDCIYLDVDTANLSLGSPAGFTDDDAEMVELLDRLKDAGVEVMIAAGNETNNALNNNFGLNMSLAKNPDIGLVSTPSTYSTVLSVGSIDSDALTQFYFTVGSEKIGYNDSGVNTRFTHLMGEELEYVVVPGYGSSDDYAGIDVAGKVAVVSRGGGVSFMDKQANAQAAGAVACVVVNNVAGMINMQINDTEEDIPAVIVDVKYWEVLNNAEPKVLVVSGDSTTFSMAKALSDFSCWGSTPDLKLKPEIAAVGGNIYSTRDTSSGYGNMSGTSMATPQAAGAMAVLLEYLRANYDYSTEELWSVAANLMMSTANPVLVPELDGVEYSPRAQGAGLIDLVKATTAGAYLSCDSNELNRPKAELGDNEDGVYSFNFTITNISDKAQTYTFDSSVLTESLAMYGDTLFIANEPLVLDTKVSVDQESVTVEPGSTVTVKASIEVLESDKEYLAYFENGIYIEGFLYAKNTDGVDLSMPFMGFYGDWSAAPVFDEADESEASLYGTYFWTNNAQLGVNPYIRGGAAGDMYNAFSYANPLAEIDAGLLRNVKDMTFRVVDNETSEVYFEETVSYVTKSYYNSNYGQIIPFYVYNANAEEEYVWRGYDKDGNKLPSGTSITYYVDTYLDDGDQILDDQISFQAVLDDKKPVLQNVDSIQDDLNVDGGVVNLTLKIEENHYLAAILFVDPEGNVIGKYGVDPDGDAEYVPGQAFEQTINIAGFGSDFMIVLADYACNETEIEVSLELSDDALNPTLQVLDSSRIYGFEPYQGSPLIEQGWFSLDKEFDGNPINESFSKVNYNSGEYVNGRVLAQRAEDGALVLLSPYSTYWGTEVIYKQYAEPGKSGYITLYDMALSYENNHQNYDRSGDDALYAVGWTYSGEKDPSGADTGTNNLYEITFTSWGSIMINTVAEITGISEGHEMLTLAAANDGTLYGITTDYKFYTIDKATGAATFMFDMNSFKAQAASYGLPLNSIQSMCYDHEKNVIYWFAYVNVNMGGSVAHICDLIEIDPVAQTTTSLGSRELPGVSAAFVPTEMETDLFTIGEQDPTWVQMNQYKETMIIGQGKRLTLKWEPWNAAPQPVEWSSDNEAVATVSKTGFVEAVAPGTATITAKTTYYDKYGYPVAAWAEKTMTCKITVVDSQDSIYGFIATDTVNENNQFKWITYGDLTPTEVTQLGAPKVTTLDGRTVSALWEGGAYYDGYVYTVQYENWTIDGVIYEGTHLYKSEVTKGETPAETIIGAPERVGYTRDIEVGNIGFDYNTGRMYGVDLTHGGLCVIDLETGSVDNIGEFKYDEYDFKSGDNIMTSMAVKCDGEETMIICGSMNGHLFLVDPETMKAQKIYNNSKEYWYYAAMTYDYNTGNIYWNPSMGAGNNPLNLVVIEENDWGGMDVSVMSLGAVGSRAGVEQTVMFTIPENEPETNFIPIESLSIENGNITGLEGGSVTIKTTTEPARPTVQRRVWTSSDTTVATVDAFGKVSYVGVGTATITVTMTDRDGSVYTDSIEVKVLPSADTLSAFLVSDQNASGYYDFWLGINDYAPLMSEVRESAINVYSLRAGEYFDGYYYAYDKDNAFYVVDAENVNSSSIIGTSGSGYENRITDMAFDYTRGIMYGLTAGYQVWNNDTYMYDPVYPKLVTINLSDGSLTEVATLDQCARTIAVDKSGVIYGAGSTYGSGIATLYTIDPETGACTYVMDLEGVSVYDDEYTESHSQLTYDFATNRLYLHGADVQYNYCYSSNFSMIQLPESEGEDYEHIILGNVALSLRGESKNGGNATLGLLCAIPKAEDLPEDMPLVNLRAAKSNMRVLAGTETALEVIAQPSTATTEFTWTSSDETIATVDENGVLTAIAEGTVVITVTDTLTGKSVQIQITVIPALSGEVAYSIATGIGLIAFDPEFPSNYIVVDSSVQPEGEVIGVDVTADGRYLYYAAYEGIFPALYRYDFNDHAKQMLGSLQVDVDISDMTYDDVNKTVYLVGGFYAYQYYVPSLKAADVNGYTRIGFDGQMIHTHAVTTVDGIPYVLGRDENGSKLMKVEVNMKSYEVINNETLAINTVNYKCEMDYSASLKKFYVSDAGNTLFSFAMPDETGTTAVEMIDTMEAGVTLNGLGIYSDPAFDWTKKDAAEKETTTEETTTEEPTTEEETTTEEPTTEEETTTEEPTTEEETTTEEATTEEETTTEEATTEEETTTEEATTEEVTTEEATTEEVTTEEATTEEATTEDTTVGDPEQIPDTGDHTPFMLWIALIIASGAVLTVTYRKNEK